MVVEADFPDQPVVGSSTVRMIADLQRLRGPLRLSVRETADGLGIHIPPARKWPMVLFIAVWLCGWAAGEVFAISELLSGGIAGLFLIIWIVPWTIAGLACMWVIGWQLFGVERLYFTAGALVREWSMLGFGGQRMLQGADIVSVKVDNNVSNDIAGIGVVKVTTAGKTMRIGNGLPDYEAQLVAELIREAAQIGASEPSQEN